MFNAFRMVRLPDPTPSGSSEAMARPDLPLQFDLELDAVVTELQLDLDLNLVRDADAHACTALDELELVVPGEVIGERVQASRDLLAREPITAARDISAAEAAP